MYLITNYELFINYFITNKFGMQMYTIFCNYADLEKIFFERNFTRNRIKRYC